MLKIMNDFSSIDRLIEFGLHKSTLNRVLDDSCGF